MEQILKFSKNVNENPCHMCMPMGGILPFKGIENTMVLIHGSQGCSTYMRRHIAEHFNEPIDVGSSSLNEKGTIYGGEKNLKKALDNVIRVYQPQMIGILTSCLAETIGEDITRIAAEYREENSESPLLVPVPTPGYGGTHSEGYWLAVKNSIVQLAKPTKKHKKLNIIVPNISPADIREIKRILATMDVKYVLCPDISSTLDSPIAKPYTKIPKGGTKLADIEGMPGAPATIQFGLTAETAQSPGHYLAEEFGVSLYNLPLPIGVENTDLFIKVLAEITGKPVPECIIEERGRLLDAMVDSHKYNYPGRAAIFGEPELVYALTTTCLENGVSPQVVASGSKQTKMQALLAPHFTKLGKESVIISEADFVEIRRLCVEQDVNIAIGHSDGRYLTEREGIPLIRIGFPILDRKGGQRLMSVGYVGTALFMDRITNTLIENKYKTYRSRMYETYYQSAQG